MDPFQRQALTCLYWHRLMSTDQIRRLIAPASPVRTVQHKLLDLHRDQLIDGIHGYHAPRAWHVTDDGAQLVEAAGQVDARPYRAPEAAVLKLLRGGSATPAPPTRSPSWRRCSRGRPSSGCRTCC
ncbi:replication-relaxation family protein [Amycolatopsis magusensis]|uniref:replication-relaxation family protein n=1 Tax=Amycolatopsis magusensis TaxID=882444 RepID=UPI0024A963F5|nr:replication-relaxation family protein [Amycolatopsis magusensis]MDI5978233.1 replication-relaxation family protein [Amycolatopsis magusensis]